MINKHLGKSLTGQSLAKLEDLSKILDQIQEMNMALSKMRSDTLKEGVIKKIKDLETEFEKQTIKLYRALFDRVEGTKLSSKDRRPLDDAVSGIISTVLKLNTQMTKVKDGQDLDNYIQNPKTKALHLLNEPNTLYKKTID